MTGRDEQLRALLRIKKARERMARKALDAAAENEQRRRTIRENALDYRAACIENADGYFRKRFGKRDVTSDFGSFFESVATGHMMAKRALVRADTTYQRVDQRHAAAAAARKAAARDLFSKTRRVEALESLLAERQDQHDTARDITEEDDLSEIARKADAVR